MIVKLEDGSKIALGDDFLKFDARLEFFRQGVVTRIDRETVVVDFGDFKIAWNRSEVSRYAQSCAVNPEFFSSPSSGEMIADYR